MFNTSITFFTEGFLFGITYLPVGDRSPEYEDEDWHELNLFLVVIKITFRWW